MSTEEEKRALNERKKNILYLIKQYLTDIGLNATVQRLQDEANLELNYEICDNVDLDTVYLEYCSYFHYKFGKYPKVLRKTIVSTSKENLLVTKGKNPQLKKKQSNVDLTRKNSDADNISITDSLKIMPISKNCFLDIHEASKEYVCRQLKDCENYSTEWKELAELICRDIIKKGPQLSWNNIFGNATAISILKESVLLPLQYPEVFNDNLKPWKGALLHGPPGTGKTLIAKTLCSETLGRATFFNMSSSSLISKWRGESEKIIRVLFEVARYYAPSIIFIDEIEGLTSKRDSSSEHEASRRFKNEFLSLLDGLDNENLKIFVLASTNLPWEIDVAFLRRFERKILINLPNDNDRKNMIKIFLPDSQSWNESIFDDVTKLCEGYTGDEIRIACKEVTMKQVRNAWNEGTVKNISEVKISSKDLKDAFKQINPTTRGLLKKHEEWNNLYGHQF